MNSSLISMIKSGKIWQHIKRPVFMKKEKSNLTEAEVIEIYNDAWFSGSSLKEIGKKYGVSKSCVSLIKLGYNWASVTGHIKGTRPNQVNKPVTEDVTDLDYWL